MTDEEKVQADVFWKMYQENIIQGRHHETQRSTVANLILVLAGVIITAITLDKKIDIIDVPLVILLIILGIIGREFCAKHYERYKLHTERARNYRDALDAVLPNINWSTSTSLKQRIQWDKLSPPEQGYKPILLLKTAADKRHKANYAETSDASASRLYQWWDNLYVFLIIFGLIIGFFAAFHQIG